MREAVRSGRIDALLLAALLTVGAAVFLKDADIGGYRYSDATAHAMDGVLILDWIKAGPQAWLSPMEFAVKQYAHYPTLGIGRRYPPGFAIVEAGAFALLGVSPMSARLCVVAFGLAAVAGSYVLLRRFADRTTALCAAAALIGTPGVVYWTRQTMLEMPTLAVLIWAAHAALCYFDRPTWRGLALAAGLVLAAGLFKQTGLFLAAVLAIIATVQAFRGRIPVRHFLLCTAVVGGLGIAYLRWMLVSGSSESFQRHLLTRGTSLGQATALQSLRIYASWAITNVGWATLALSAVGAVLVARRRSPMTALLLLWSALFLVMTLSIQTRDPRFLFYGYFPAAACAGLALSRMVELLRSRAVRQVALAAWVLAAACVGYRTPIPYTPDYAPIIERYADRIRGQMVLYEGYCEGDFISAVRSALGPRQAVVLRGSKALYSCAMHTRFAFESHVRTRDDVRRFLDAYGVQMIFLERRNVAGLREVELLREELNDATRYRRLAAIRLPKPGSQFIVSGRLIDAYEPITPPARRTRVLDIPLPIDGRNIKVDLDSLLALADE